MSVLINYSLPWNLRVSPYIESARSHSIEWMRSFGLLDDECFTAQHFVDWRLADLAAYFYPEATEEGLDLGCDLMGWYFAPFDDQFDGALGKDPRRVASICAQLMDIVDSTEGPVPVGRFPTANALADMWRRSRDGMSLAWRTRASHNWKQYITTQVVEAINRRHNRVLSLESYIWQGRTVVSAHVVNDLRERVSGFEVGSLAWYSQVLSEMRDLAAEFVLTDNDLYSLEKEERTGDVVNNMVLILESQEGLSRSEAIARMKQLSQGRVARFQQLEQQLPELFSALDEGSVSMIGRYVDGLHDIMCGSYQWGRESGRYVVGGQLSPDQLQHSLAATAWQPLGTSVVLG